MRIFFVTYEKIRALVKENFIRSTYYLLAAMSWKIEELDFIYLQLLSYKLLHWLLYFALNIIQSKAEFSCLLMEASGILFL